jgi:hypothetical protein
MRIKSVDVVVPAGQYVLGDPCYAVPDDKWDELLDSCNYFENPVGHIRFDEHAEYEKIKHTEINFLNLDRFIYNIDTKAQKLIAELNEWKKQDMTLKQMQDLAYKAARLRFNESDENFNPIDLLRVNRTEDKGNDIWTVFNRIQENLTHDVKDKQLDIWLNKQLYELANKELVYV